jgi:hypothetical protein
MGICSPVCVCGLVGGFDWLASVPCGVRIPGSWTIQSLPYQADALTGIALFGIGPTTKQTAIHELELRSSYVLPVEHGWVRAPWLHSLAITTAVFSARSRSLSSHEGGCTRRIQLSFLMNCYETTPFTWLRPVARVSSKVGESREWGRSHAFVRSFTWRAPPRLCSPNAFGAFLPRLHQHHTLNLHIYIRGYNE